jgi:hypothetical protein
MVDGDTQRLKRARCGMNLLPLPATNSARDQISKLPGRCDWLSLFSLLNDPTRYATRLSLFTVFKDDPGNFGFRKFSQEFRGGRSTRRVHSHIERSVKTKTETSFGGIELQR